MLHAYEELTYTNNSPDTLHYIYLHLWPNAYKDDHTPLERQFAKNGNTSFYFSKPKDKGYIDSLLFTIDGLPAEYFTSKSAPDIARLDLVKPLLPGKTIKIITPFRIKIPKVFSRMGHTKQAYYITQWFPKPAVYDQKGWHPISYLDQGEFYSEYGSYDVSITLPANYVVMATGNCLDETENTWMDSLSKKPLPTTEFTGRKAHLDEFPSSALETKTLHFHEDNIHDFAWFADKRWLVRKDTVMSPGNNQVVTTWAAFMPSYWKTWQNANDYLKATVRNYGKWVGPYQYKTIKAVCGDLRAGGGMEYPTVTVIERTTSGTLRTVIIHEAGHNWFYGMLGSNERDHAWMDEGINTFYEQKTSKELDTLKIHKKGASESILYYERASIGEDQAIDQTSGNFEKMNYGLDVYFKTAMSLRWLEAYIGEKDFEAGMHDYYNTWHFHHPYPEDLEICLKRHTNKSVGWFFDTILKTDKKIDFTITRAKMEGGAIANTTVTVKNNAHVIAPVLINSFNKGKLTSSVWSEPFSKKTTITLNSDPWDKLTIDNVIPDAKSTNNVYKRNRLFHHFGLKVKPLAGLNIWDNDRLYFLPAVAYNQYDGIMAGLVLHNLTVPENRFRFVVAPLYSFQTKSFVGCGSVGYAWYPNNAFKEILAQVDAKTFHDNHYEIYNYLWQFKDVINPGYTKVAPSLNFTFNEHDATSPIKRMLTIKGYSIGESNLDTFSAPKNGHHFLTQKQNYYGLLRYSHINNRTYNPFSYRIEGQIGADFAKLGAEGNLRVDYNKAKKALYIRAFFGKYFIITNTTDAITRYELNASYSGMDDYLYDGTCIARNATGKIASQQISIQEGGFKVPALNNAARSDNWMGTINLSTDLPMIKLPIRLFFDAGLIPNANPSFRHSNANTVLYDGGIEIHLINNVVSLYIPLIMSSDFQNYLTNAYGKKNVFGRSISFTMQFQNLNWLKAPSKGVKILTGN